jgi:hypothetical protein
MRPKKKSRKDGNPEAWNSDIVQARKPVTYPTQSYSAGRPLGRCLAAAPPAPGPVLGLETARGRGSPAIQEEGTRTGRRVRQTLPRTLQTRREQRRFWGQSGCVGLGWRWTHQRLVRLRWWGWRGRPSRLHPPRPRRGEGVLCIGGRGGVVCPVTTHIMPMRDNETGEQVDAREQKHAAGSTESHECLQKWAQRAAQG